jgi:hypothetical protein
LHNITPSAFILDQTDPFRLMRVASHRQKRTYAYTECFVKLIFVCFGLPLKENKKPPWGG